MKCEKCGKYSGYYPLCRSCYNKKNEEKRSETCLICYQDKELSLCEDCISEAQLFYSKNDKKITCASDLKNYYINIFRKAEKSDDREDVEKLCIKLYALANLNNENFQDSSLLSKLVENVCYLLEGFEDVDEEFEDDIIEESSQNKLVYSNDKRVYTTKDGHKVKSEGEQAIDNILYEHRIVHCYEKYLLVDDEDDSVECDWFIPILNDIKGIYIEYWGMEKKRLFVK